MRVYERLQGRMVALRGVEIVPPRGSDLSEQRGLFAPVALGLLAALAVLVLGLAGGVL